jgi:hypothetical protein
VAVAADETSRSSLRINHDPLMLLPISTDTVGNPFGETFFDMRDTGVTSVMFDLALQGLIGFDVGAGSFFVRPELLRLLKRGNNRDANQDDLALAV